jgi:hypothetical protein
MVKFVKTLEMKVNPTFVAPECGVLHCSTSFFPSKEFTQKAHTRPCFATIWQLWVITSCHIICQVIPKVFLESCCCCCSSELLASEWTYELHQGRENIASGPLKIFAISVIFCGNLHKK